MMRRHRQERLRVVGTSSIPTSVVALSCWLFWCGAAQYDRCNGTVADIGNGRCDMELNAPACGYDGGDCCWCTCVDGPSHSCSDSVFDCLYPECDIGWWSLTSYATFSSLYDTLAGFCEESLKSDGQCDTLNNHGGCGFDGGDCCECSCVDGPVYECDTDDMLCTDPACYFDPVVIAEYPDCEARWPSIGDGKCNAQNNHVLCGFDGGDCCPCTCTGAECPTHTIDCVDPGAGDELWECETPSPMVLPCSPEAQQMLVVDTSEGVRALAAAAHCSGGSFEVEWRGHVVVDEPIYVVNGTVLTVTGSDSTAVVDGAGLTRPFTVINATLHLSGVNVSSGASIVGGAVAAAASVLSFKQTSFVSNSATASGGAIHASDGSSVSCAGGVVFADNVATLDGGAMHVAGGSVVSCGGLWVNNTAGTGGGALSVYEESAVSWDDESVFSNNLAPVGGALVVESSNVSWSGPTTISGNRWEGDADPTGGGVAVYDGSLRWSSETEFTSNTGGAIVAISSELSWTGRTNFALNNSTVAGGAMTLLFGSTASWGAERTTFTGNLGPVGGAMYVLSSEVTWSGDTVFAGNRATSGGALYIVNGSTVAWSANTDFFRNDATGDGGAVATVPSDSLNSAAGLDDSALVVSGNTAFINNTCGANGGALALLGALAADIDAVEVSFIGNTAAVAGGAVLVSGVGIGPVFRNTRFVSNSAEVGGAVSAVGSGNLLREHGIQPTTFERCLFTDNTAAATGGAVESASGRDSFINSVFEGNAAREGGAVRLAGTTSIKNCTFAENVSEGGGGAAVSNIGSFWTMENIFFAGNVFSCEPGMFLDFTSSGDPYDAVCSGCPTGCDDCSFKEPSLVPMCTAAMVHASSAGGTATLEMLSIERGYWRATPSSEEILACYNADACLGGVTGAPGYCLEGYEGPYCSVCSGGYTAELSFTCSKCSHSAGGIALAAILAVAVLVVAVAVVLYVMSGQVEAGRQGMVERLGRFIPLHSVKIVIVAWQILTQFTSVVNVTYPDVYQTFLGALDVFNFDLGWVISAGCVVEVDFHDRLLISTIGPIVALLFLGATYVVGARINRGVAENVQIIRNKHVSMMLLLTFLVYSSVSSTLFKAFACDELADGKNYLRADYSIECDSSKHRGFQGYAALMIVLYPVGIPVFYSVLLFRDRDVLKQSDADREETARIRSTSDLWGPYKPSVFYYEVIECVRRVFLAGVVVFIYPNTAAQIALTLLMAFVFVVVSEALAPYASRWDTWLSRIGHSVVYVSMYVALLLKVDVSDERAGSQEVFATILVATHACMILVVVVETVVLTCALRAEQLEEPSLSFRRKKAFFRSRVPILPAEDNPFADDIYQVELPPVA